MSIYKGTELLAGVATNTIENAHSLLDFKWTDHILNELSWLRADTFSWQSGSVYVGAYNHILADYSGGTSQTETVGSYTITYVLADDGHKITTDETTVSNIYAESGSAWYYILDTVNTRFKLPRINPVREELIQIIRAKGNGIAIGMTDGTNLGGAYRLQMSNLGGSAVILLDKNSYGSAIGQTANVDRTWGSSYTTAGITTDSTKSGIISSMTDSTSVYKGHKYLYFYVGNYSQSATEQTAGLNAELFNGKLDLDMGNATSSTKQTIVGWGIPDYTAGMAISVPTNSATYTAPSAGIYVLAYEGSSPVSGKHMLVNGSIVYRYQYSSAANPAFNCLIFLNKGDVISSDTTASPSTIKFSIFYPMKGVAHA